MQSIRSSVVATGFVYLCGSCLWAPSASAQTPANVPSKAGAEAVKPASPPDQPRAQGARADGKPAADAAAAPDNDRSAQVMAEAKQRFDRGFELYEEGEYPLALIEFTRAYELVPNYRVLYNIGQVCIQLGQYANARRALEEYRQKGGESLGKDRREAVAKDLDMLERRTAFLLITTNVDDAEVMVDDVSVGKTPLDPALLIDAGVHRIAVRRHGYLQRTALVTLAGGDKQTLALTLDVQPEEKPTFVVQRAEPEDSQTLMIAGWITTGVLVAGAIVTGIMGAGEADELEQLKGADQREYDDLGARLDDTKSNASALLLASDVFSGAAILVGGLTLWITIDPIESGSPAADDKSLAASPKGLQVGYQEGQVQVRGSF